MTKTRILYAEDERDLRELTCEILTSEGYDCTPVIDGVEAQKLFGQQSFDLLLTDFNMPNLDGAALLFWCRKNNYHVPVVFITGTPEKLPVHRKALQDASASIIHKPFNFKDLVNAIEQGLDNGRLFKQHGKINELESDDMFFGQHYI